MKSSAPSEDKDVAPIRILLADDHPLLREGFTHALEEYADTTVVESTATPEAAIELFGKLKPDVVVMDILFAAETTGLTAIKEILSRQPKAKIVALSQHEQAALIKEVYKLGALAFVPKNADVEELHTAILKVYEGETYFLPGVAERLAILSVGDNSPYEVLSKREFAVYRLTALDKNTREIAEDLGINEKAVSNAMYALKQKLRLSRSTEITKHALRHGVISLH